MAIVTPLSAAWSHQVRPHLLGILPVVRLGLGAVGTDEGVDHGHFHHPGSGDHLVQVVVDRLPVVRVGMERVRVVAQPGYLDATLGEIADDVGSLVGREPVDVEVADAGIAAGDPLGLWPGAHLEGTNPLAAAQSATSVSGVSGKGAVSSPSFMGVFLSCRPSSITVTHRPSADDCGRPLR